MQTIGSLHRAVVRYLIPPETKALTPKQAPALDMMKLLPMIPLHEL